MTSPASPTPPPPATPGEVRRALLDEELGQFDREWRAAMARAAEDLDLTDVYRVLDRWRTVAAMTRQDPAAHHRMLDRADRVLAGTARGTVTADDQRAMIARRLGQQ